MMLAAGEEEIITLTIVFAFVLMVIGLSIWSKHKQARYRLIERALDSGNLDEATRKQLIDGISATGWMATLQQQLAFLARNAFLVAGWLGIFAGLGTAAWGGAGSEEDMLGAGLLVTFISFGVVTIPLALRELHARRRA